MENSYTRKYAQKTLEVLAYRKSCRQYTGEQITEEELDVILEAGNAAPIGRNRVDEIKIIVVQDQALLNELEENAKGLYAKMGIERKVIYNAPTLIIVAVKKLEGAYAKAQYCSAACILENMIMAATEMRLGNVYLSGVTTALNENQALLRKVGVPEDYEAASSVAIGNTDETFQKRDLLPYRIQVERR